MAHLSQSDLWGPGDNHVVTLPPSPGDLLVITTVDGKRVLMHPIHEYEWAVSTAQAFTRHWRADQPVTIKVLCLSGREAIAMGYLPAPPFRNVTPEQRAEARRFVVNNLWRIIRDSNEPKPRAEALRLLKEMGELK